MIPSGEDIHSECTKLFEMGRDRSLPTREILAVRDYEIRRIPCFKLRKIASSEPAPLLSEYVAEYEEFQHRMKVDYV